MRLYMFNSLDMGCYPQRVTCLRLGLHMVVLGGSGTFKRKGLRLLGVCSGKGILVSLNPH
jgi:hypothetical protein